MQVYFDTVQFENEKNVKMKFVPSASLIKNFLFTP